MTLWKRSGSVSKITQDYCVGADPLHDLKLAQWDCYGSLAQAKMLHSIGVLSKEEHLSLKNALVELIEKIRAGNFQINLEQEDCHTAIEEFLTEKCGEAGKRIHTGRSRNDQVLTMMKLYIKAELLHTSDLALKLALALLQFAERNPTPLPGYTHLRRGMPSSVALWAGAYAEACLDNSKFLCAALDQLDSSPLGSAAGYGVPIALDREMTAKDLGFARVHWNTLAVQNSRGKSEALALSALSQVMLDLNRCAGDLILFSTAEFGFFNLPAEFCTGSSIMPQKLNPDVLELMRAKAKVVFSLQQQVLGITADLPAGYNRDLQLTKAAMIEGFEITEASLAILAALIPGVTVNTARCKEALDPSVFAAHHATTLAAKGMPFRDAYHVTKEKLTTDPQSLISDVKDAPYNGTPTNPALKEQAAILKILHSEVEKHTQNFHAALDKLSSN